MIKIISTLLLLGIISASQAAPIIAYEFETDEQEQLFNRLSNDVRCLVCQNQSIAESNAGLAQDLRKEIHKMISDGQSETEIVDFLVQRYGDYVLYNPPVKPLTWLLWFGPAIVFFVALFLVIRFIRSQSTQADEKSISIDDEERLKNLQSESRNK